MIKPWDLVRTQPAGKFVVFSIRTDLKISPRTRREHEFIVLECPNWVNVIAVTPDNKLVMVEQLRHGTNTVELEIPGGVMDAEDGSPEVTGTRELREETGYEGTPSVLIGQVYSNPAIMNNTCYTVFIEQCEFKHDTQFDTGEDLITHLIPFEEIPALVAARKIRHSLVIAALYHYELWRRKKG